MSSSITLLIPLCSFSVVLFCYRRCVTCACGLVAAAVFCWCQRRSCSNTSLMYNYHAGPPLVASLNNVTSMGLIVAATWGFQLIVNESFGLFPCLTIPKLTSTAHSQVLSGRLPNFSSTVDAAAMIHAPAQMMLHSRSQQQSTCDTAMLTS